MEIEIISFGRISEFIKSQKLDITGISDTGGLKDFLEEKFPELKNMKYKIALNKQIVQHNMELDNHAAIAIMPPFSGG